MNLRLFCCMRHDVSHESTPSKPREKSPTSRDDEIFGFRDVIQKNQTLSSIAVSMTDTGSGLSEAAREIRRIFGHTHKRTTWGIRSGSLNNKVGGISNKEIQPRRSLNRLSQAIRKRFSHESGNSVTGSEKARAVRKSDGEVERHGEFHLVYKEKLEEELRHGSTGGYDSDAEIIGTINSKCGQSNSWLSRMAGHEFGSGPSPIEECEAIDVGLARAYRSILAHMESGSSPSLRSMQETSSTTGHQETNEAHASPDNLDHGLHWVIPTSRRNEAPEKGEDSGSKASEVSRSIQYEGISINENSPPQAQVHDSGIYLGLASGVNSASSSEVQLPEWLRSANSLIDKPGHDSLSAREEPGASSRCSNATEFGRVDGQKDLSQISAYTHRTDKEQNDNTNSPSTIMVPETKSPLRTQKRSFSDDTFLVKRNKHTLLDQENSQRSFSLNSFRKKIFNINSYTASGNFRQDSGSEVKPRRSASTKSRRVKQKSEFPWIRRQVYGNKLFASSTDSFIAQQLASAKRIVPRPRASTVPRKSRFKEELSEDVDSVQSEDPRNTPQDLSVKSKWRRVAAQGLDGNGVPEIRLNSLELEANSPFGRDTVEKAWTRALRLHKIDVADRHRDPKSFDHGGRRASPSHASMPPAQHGNSIAASLRASRSGSSHNDSSEHSWYSTFNSLPGTCQPPSYTPKSGRSLSILPKESRSPSVEFKKTNSKAARAICFPKKKPSGTWARFPSHEREIRNGPAGASDGVDPHDFARHVSLPAKRMADLKPDWGKSGLVKRIKQEFINRFCNNSHGHRSSISLGGEVNYPELEVLPNLELPFYVYGEDETESSTWLGPDGNACSSTMDDHHLQMSRPVFGFNLHSVRRKSTHVAPDVLVDETEEKFPATEGIGVALETASSAFLSPADALRQSRSESGTLGTSYSRPASDNHAAPGDAQPATSSRWSPSPLVGTSAHGD